MAAALSLEPGSLSLSGFPATSFLSELDSLRIGVAVFDRRLRYRAVSRALAEFTNLPVEAHPGTPMHHVVESTLIRKAEPSFDHVFSTGQPLSNLRRSGQLLTRPGRVFHWLSYYFPLVDNRRRVVDVGVIVTQLQSSPVSLGSLDLVKGPASHKGPQAAGQLFHSGARNRSGFASTRQTDPILSSREQQVLRLLAEGKSNKEISSILAIGVKTVETYRSRLMRKLHAPSLIYLVHYAIRHKLVDLQA
jgi:DNA-binding CsgD family transcriptional regulator